MIRYSIVVLLCSAAALLQGCVPAVVVGAGAATAVVVSDRRQPEVILGDKRIEYTGSSRIGDAWGGKAHINISSYNYTVLLTGEAPTPEAKAAIEKIASEIPQVRNVVNEIEVSGNSSATSRSSDTFITASVKANLISGSKGKFEPDQVKVVTERGVVYLLGLVTREEADAITDVARTTSGVMKVVRVFEYIEPPEKMKSPEKAK